MGNNTNGTITNAGDAGAGDEEEDGGREDLGGIPAENAPPPDSTVAPEPAPTQAADGPAGIRNDPAEVARLESLAEEWWPACDGPRKVKAFCRVYPTDWVEKAMLAARIGAESNRPWPYLNKVLAGYHRNGGPLPGGPTEPPRLSAHDERVMRALQASEIVKQKSRERRDFHAEKKAHALGLLDQLYPPADAGPAPGPAEDGGEDLIDEYDAQAIMLGLRQSLGIELRLAGDGPMRMLGTPDRFPVRAPRLTDVPDEIRDTVISNRKRFVEVLKRPLPGHVSPRCIPPPWPVEIRPHPIGAMTHIPA